MRLRISKEVADYILDLLKDDQEYLNHHVKENQADLSEYLSLNIEGQRAIECAIANRKKGDDQK